VARSSHSYEEKEMPQVGGKKFSYTKQGQKAAKKYAKKTGKYVSKLRDMRSYVNSYGK